MESLWRSNLLALTFCWLTFRYRYLLYLDMDLCRSPSGTANAPRRAAEEPSVASHCDHVCRQIVLNHHPILLVQPLVTRQALHRPVCLGGDNGRVKILDRKTNDEQVDFRVHDQHPTDLVCSQSHEFEPRGCMFTDVTPATYRSTPRLTDPGHATCTRRISVSVSLPSRGTESVI